MTAATPAVTVAGSSYVCSVSRASRRLYSAMTGRSAGVAARTVSSMVASRRGNPYRVIRLSAAEAPAMDLKAFIRDIPDFPKPGIVFKDITPLLADPVVFRHAIDRLGTHFDGRPIDAIAAAEARGFLFAAPLALRLPKPLVPLRKPAKLPYRP